MWRCLYPYSYDFETVCGNRIASLEPFGGEILLTFGQSRTMNLTNRLCAGFSLFLAMMIDRLHHYIRELRIRRKTMEAVKKQNRVFEDGKPAVPEEIKALEEEKATLSGRIKQLETQLEEKTKEASSSEANAVALKKQSEGFLLEYDRLLEENQNLRSQLQSLDRRLSHSDIKKVA